MTQRFHQMLRNIYENYNNKKQQKTKTDFYEQIGFLITLNDFFFFTCSVMIPSISLINPINFQLSSLTLQPPEGFFFQNLIIIINL